MADTYTSNLNMTKPEVGASRDTWGTKMNANLDTLDSAIATLKGNTGGIVYYEPNALNDLSSLSINNGQYSQAGTFNITMKGPQLLIIAKGAAYAKDSGGSEIVYTYLVVKDSGGNVVSQSSASYTSVIYGDGYRQVTSLLGISGTKGATYTVNYMAARGGSTSTTPFSAISLMALNLGQ